MIPVIERFASIRQRLEEATCGIHKRGGCGCMFYGSMPPDDYADMVYLLRIANAAERVSRVVPSRSVAMDKLKSVIKGESWTNT